MDHDRIRKELTDKHRPGSVIARLGGINQVAAILTGGAVPGPIRAVLDQAFMLPADRTAPYRFPARGVLGPELADLTDTQWNRVVGTLLPEVATSAVSACVALAARPFQDGQARKPFRCPRSRLWQADIRGRWLLRTTILIGDYEGDIRWIAEHAAHLAGYSGGTELGWLLAGALNLGGEPAAEIEQILMESATGEHPTGQMGHHVAAALLSCERPSAWAFVEKLLLSAQRQEGVRQAILESVDESHPQAFQGMLRLILEENLGRFSSVVRAADTWFGFLWDGSSAVKLEAILRRALLFLEDAAARDAALSESDAETVYLALWSAAFQDVETAIEPAARLLSSPSADIRFVATHFLVQSLWPAASPHLVSALADADLRVAARALDNFVVDRTDIVDGKQLFHELEQLIARAPARAKQLESLVWPWWKRKLERVTVASALVANAAAVAPERVLAYVPDLAPNERAGFLRRAAGLMQLRRILAVGTERRQLTPAERVLAIELLGDSSAEVRAAAFDALEELPLEHDEVERLLDLLARKPSDLRTRGLVRLRSLDDAALLIAADRLVGDGDERRRLAGLELLRDAIEQKRSADAARERFARYQAEHGTLSEEERAHVTAALAERVEVATVNDALGLVRPASLRTWPEPRERQIVLDTPAARAATEDLATLILANQGAEVRSSNGEVKLLLETTGYSFGARKREQLADPSPVPLADTWRTWLRNRSDDLRDSDALELVRAVLTDATEPAWSGPAVKTLKGVGRWSHGTLFLRGILEWCLAWDPPARIVDFLIDGFEGRLATFTPDDYEQLAKAGTLNAAMLLRGMGNKEPNFEIKARQAGAWLTRVRWWRTLFPASIGKEHAERIYGLLRHFQERSGANRTLTIVLNDFLGAYRAEAVGEDEFLSLLIGRWSTQPHASLLREASSHKPPRGLGEHPELLAAVDRARRRVVEVECTRGDRTSAASVLARELRMTGGLDTLKLALPALGKAHFTRAFSSAASRPEALSHFVLRSLPGDGDTTEKFAEWARKARISEARLVELAVYAPQWAAHVNHVLQWPGFESGVWWIQAHTKDDRSWNLRELKEVWAAEVSERTPLAADELTEGAVDVAWFAEAHAALGAERWKALDAAAKYAASSGGHTRAQLFARAMGGVVTREELFARIDKRHQDSVRALGLLPLAGGDEREHDLLTRYERLEEFRRESRKFGSQRKANEGRAVAIAMDNLARTAGYRDPQRLQWAMERAATADLARGPVVLARGDVTLSLSLDADGVAALSTTKNGKALKAIPAALKTDAAVEELKDRLQALKRQRSRVRAALEEALCRGDGFSARDLGELLGHPVLAPSVSRLVFVGDGVAGYVDEGGRILRDHAGMSHVLGSREEVRIAHPIDLLARGDLSAWQRECFRTERVQPFKQIFRELYPLTDTERGTERSRRFAGHQVNPRQAIALLSGRGWVVRPDEGVSRTFHEAGLTARLGFQEPFYTPAEIEGLTLEEVVFTRKGQWKLVPLDEIPPRLFSETMRDMDLVVSVAHQGGVDPEATASTVEMRAALIRESCELLRLDNVRIDGHHAFIRGSLGEYSVHLGSAGAMLLPGTSIPIVAVHSQHRGRMFLPFADDDPRSAEVLSKILLLARDEEIRDPAILAWIRAGKSGGEA